MSGRATRKQEHLTFLAASERVQLAPNVAAVYVRPTPGACRQHCCSRAGKLFLRTIRVPGPDRRGQTLGIQPIDRFMRMTKILLVVADGFHLDRDAPSFPLFYRPPQQQSKSRHNGSLMEHRLNASIFFKIRFATIWTTLVVRTSFLGRRRAGHRKKVKYLKSR